MLKSDLVETDKHSIIILLRRKNLRFLRRTNHHTNTLALILFRYLSLIWLRQTLIRKHLSFKGRRILHC
jgi:hypothetical protein